MKHVYEFVTAFLLACGLWVQPVQADLTDDLAQYGLAATEERLATATEPGDLFALAGVRFLRGIERSFQRRWAMGQDGVAGPLPILRIGLPPNPAPEPFDPALVERIFSDIQTDMETVRAALDQIGDRDFAVSLDIDALWFDVNMNATFDPGEEVSLLLNNTAGWRQPFASPAQDEAPEPLLVRFDRADAAWLRAYSHLVSGIGALVLAFDPTETIASMIEADAEMKRISGPTRQFLPVSDNDLLVLATYLAAFETRPIARHTMKAHAHFRDMIRANRAFWAAVETETDNVDEWIPNDRQDAATGMEFPAGLGDTWLAVLDDADRVLTGELLVPYTFRLGTGAGINLRKLAENPPDLSLVGVLHGRDLVPYMERGPVMTSASWRQFNRMVLGQSILFALVLN